MRALLFHKFKNLCIKTILWTRNTNCFTISVHRNFRRKVHSKLWVSYTVVPRPCKWGLTEWSCNRCSSKKIILKILNKMVVLSYNLLQRPNGQKCSIYLWMMSLLSYIKFRIYWNFGVSNETPRLCYRKFSRFVGKVSLETPGFDDSGCRLKPLVLATDRTALSLNCLDDLLDCCLETKV